MQAFVIDSFKTPGRMTELPLPELGADDIRVRVTAAGVNPIDWKIRNGAAPNLPLPRVLGQDVAGVVEAVGSAVKRFAAGDRVLGVARTHGGYADATVVAENDRSEPISKIPDGVDDALAAALPTPGLTALACLNAAGVANGTPVVILGAAGAVGAIATQLAVMRGSRVTAIVKDGAAQIRGFGVERVIESTDPSAIVTAVRAAVPGGVTAVLDLVSDGATLKRFADLLAPGGTIITTNHVADEAWFRGRGLRAINLAMNQTPESSPSGLDQLTGLVRDGKLVVDVRATRPLADAGSILDGGENHSLRGKYVLRPAGANR